MTPTPAPPAGLTVFLVDDHAIVRSGVSAYIDMIDDITVAGEAGTGQLGLPVVVLTTAASQRDQAQQSGAAAFLEKDGNLHLIPQALRAAAQAYPKTRRQR